MSSITGSYLTKNVGTDLPIVTSAVVLSGTDAMDYTLVQPTGLTASITPRPLDVTATGVEQGVQRHHGRHGNPRRQPHRRRSLTITSTECVPDQGCGHRQVHQRFQHHDQRRGRRGLHAVNGSTSTYANITPATLTVVATGVNKVYNGTTAATVIL